MNFNKATVVAIIKILYSIKMVNKDVLVLLIWMICVWIFQWKIWNVINVWMGLIFQRLNVVKKDFFPTDIINVKKIIYLIVCNKIKKNV